MDFFRAYVELCGILTFMWNYEVFAKSACGEPPGQQFCLSAFSWASLGGISTFGWNSRGFWVEFFKAWVELGGIGWNLEVFANSACGEPPEQQFCLWGLLGSNSACRHSPGPV